MRAAWWTRLSAAAPATCAVCGAWPATPVCAACRARFAAPRPRCSLCAMPVPAGIACCGACLRRPPPLDACHAAVDYAYPWAGLVARCKFEGEPGWAVLLAELAAGAQGVAAELSAADLLLPMPLAAQRLAWRGFNQSLEIARRLAPAKVDAGLLLRLRETRPQAELHRDERRANVRGAFGVEPLRAAEVAGRRIVLVDDVMTSGASLHAAAQALRQARAARVAAVVVARTDEAG